jgi:hypothetical protein
MKTEKEDFTLVDEGILLPLSRPAAERLLRIADIGVKSAQEMYDIVSAYSPVSAATENTLSFFLDLQSTLKTLLEK